MIQPLFFFSVTQNDFFLAQRLVAQISRLYPECQALGVSDGYVSDFFNLFDLSEKLILIEGVHLKKEGSIAEFTTRNFNLILQLTQESHIIKLDPDSFLKKRFKNIPENSPWSGEVAYGACTWGPSFWARGGGFVIQRSTIEKVVESNLLFHSRYRELQKDEKEIGRAYEDCRLGHVANCLGVLPSKWSEVSCGKLPVKDKRVRKMALVHPVKTIND